MTVPGDTRCELDGSQGESEPGWPAPPTCCNATSSFYARFRQKYAI